MLVAVGVGVLVGVGVGVLVGARVGMLVGSGVLVAVGLGVFVGVGSCPNPKSHSSRLVYPSPSSSPFGLSGNSSSQ